MTIINYFKLLLLFVIFMVTGFSGYTQTNPPFWQEVETISKKYDTLWDKQRETILFTGSSSIRLWNSLEKSFPEHQILNTGFGGSQATDLLYYLDKLVLRYAPKKVFIYEGDNDIFAKKRIKEIIQTTSDIISKIKVNDPTTEIILISAKPSISRWNYRRRYKRLNKKYLKLSEQDSLLSFVDVWNPMLNGRKLKTDIFIEDGLHMNQKGYDLWYKAMKGLINTTNN